MSQLVDQADWSDVVLKSTNVIGSAKNSQLTHNGYRYATHGELLLAQLLDQLGIPFTPNVRFDFDDTPVKGGQKTPKGKVYVPDFIFNKRAYVWTDPDTGEQEVIHGLEAKNRCSRTSNPKTRLLYGHRKIRVRLICTQDIERFMKAGALPIAPL
jgi:hypothetical protein